MQDLYKPSQYPSEIQANLKRMSPLAIEIANRWALGWPKRVKALIDANEYLEALNRQEEQERTVLSNPGLSHLARHEIVQEYGLSLEPPTTSTTSSSQLLYPGTDAYFRKFGGNLPGSLGKFAANLGLVDQLDSDLGKAAQAGVPLDLKDYAEKLAESHWQRNRARFSKE
jgi:hypothetical protein